MRITPIFLLVIWMISCREKAADQSSPGHAITEAGSFFHFIKADSVNPVLVPDSSLLFTCPIVKKTVRWEEKDVFNPAAIIKNDTLFLIYRAEDKIGKFAGTSRIGLAWSLDGLHFTKHPVPVFYPDEDEQKKWEWEGGCEDPRIVQDENGIYYMTYTAYDGDKARMLVASSPDLYHWTKHGHIFANAYNGKYVGVWTKSGSIVSHYKKGSPVATRIKGKYWMYGGDVNIWAAHSDDLVNWTPVLLQAGENAPLPLRHNSTEIADFKFVFGPREKKFDSDLVEPGPPAMLTDSAIWLVYNSRNIKDGGDSSLAEGTYAAGYIVIDKDDPLRVIDRSATYFIKPDKPYEINGQVNHVCFVEGLVQYHGKWFLYYGTADSRIAVAVKE
ncbi:MAG TPA: glycoside hydrolase family 130 protein [Chitinophagaceae bacterium]|nr:glycoside hydrolase family 130 protein [Chitinophagaceae bacterium]